MSKKLKPFDLQAALQGKPVMLRNGEEAYVRHHETELRVFSGLQLQGIGLGGELYAWTGGGRNCSGVVDHHVDIIGMYLETRSINGFEVPAPETRAPKSGTRCYLASPTKRDYYSREFWNANPLDMYLLERGLVFLAKEDAIANAKAMLGIDPDSGSK